MNKGIIWQVGDHVRYRRLLDEGVLIHQDQASAMVINDTGTAFLEHCDGHRPTGQIIDELCEIYDVDSVTLEKDIGVFIDELANKGIIQVVTTE